MAPKETNNNFSGAENDLQNELLLAPLHESTESYETKRVDSEAKFLLKLIFFRVVYFFDGLSSSTWGRFGIIYYNQVKKLPPAQIGILSGVLPLISLVTQPLWGAMADKIHSRKYVYLLCKLLSTCALLGLSLSSVDNFWKVFGCVAGMAVFKAGGVLDAHTIDFLGEANRGLYGTVRVWAAISWGLGAVIMGYITDYFSFGLNFWLYGIMSFGMFFVVAFGLSTRSLSEQARYDNHVTSQSDLRLLIRTLLKPPVLLWLAEVAWIGAAMSLVESFLFVFLQNNLQASTVLCGWTVGITVLFELPIFWCSKYLLKNVGHDGLFLISLLAHATRVFGYTLLQPSTVHWVLPLEILHGVTFASMWIASVDYSATVAPEEWSTTVQSILSTVMSSVGGGIGPILGGLVVKKYGFVILYKGAGCITASVACIHFALWLWGRGHDAFLERLATEDRKHEAGIQMLVPKVDRAPS